MGNSQQPSISSIPFQVDFDSLKQNNTLKINGKTHIVYRESKTNNLYVQYNIPFETDSDYRLAHKALVEIKKFSHTNILKVACVLVDDRRLRCSPSSFRLFTEYHDKTLHEIIQQKKQNEYFESEHKIWKLLFSTMEILHAFFENKIDFNFVHTQSVYYNAPRDNFGLIHPFFFTENNFTEALIGNEHFCSPELYYQILSKNKKFLLVENDKSNSFSLGLLVIYLLHSSQKLKMDELYNINTISVNMSKIRQLINSLFKMNFSKLLVQVLIDMTNEFEHVRLSPQKFLNWLGTQRVILENAKCDQHELILSDYMKCNNLAENYELNGKMSHAFGFDGENGFQDTSHVNNEDLVNNLKQKSNPFNNKYLAQDQSF